uniref:Uncharacterized protein n=1 Tax=Klebsiella phage PMBT63 TaxID=3229739 RepID=A0AB39C398_9CAUD
MPQIIFTKLFTCLHGCGIIAISKQHGVKQNDYIIKI